MAVQIRRTADHADCGRQVPELEVTRGLARPITRRRIRVTAANVLYVQSTYSYKGSRKYFQMVCRDNKRTTIHLLPVLRVKFLFYFFSPLATRISFHSQLS